MEDQLEYDILQQIKPDELLQLRDLYKINWPTYSPIYNHIDMAHTWITKNNEEIKFYSVNGYFDDGTVIFISNLECDKIKLTYYTLEKSNSRLYDGLMKTKRIDWNKQICLDTIYRDQLPLSFEIAKAQHQQFYSLAIGSCWWLPKEKAAQFEIKIPNHTFVGPLSLEHAEKIYRSWTYNGHRSVEYVASLIKNNNCFGIFHENDRTLMAWVLLREFGVLGILQTDEKYKRRGYATVVTKALCKKIAENNADSICYINVENTASKKLFESLGFKAIDYYAWMKMKPNVDTCG
ncbi:uncharacterized protein LOC123300787 [Chrysoperla carnea]|uniref:uncharacterized protein LOC123300787 n=1 Tax=Chrysoperla carnea TaxID=189513 RepID=UPI001D0928C2|nr:uncharacterized protein LOC123300787 [Chrysoperla carnea]